MILPISAHNTEPSYTLARHVRYCHTTSSVAHTWHVHHMPRVVYIIYFFKANFNLYYTVIILISATISPFFINIKKGDIVEDMDGFIGTFLKASKLHIFFNLYLQALYFCM